MGPAKFDIVSSAEDNNKEIIILFVTGTEILLNNITHYSTFQYRIEPAIEIARFNRKVLKHTYLLDSKLLSNSKSLIKRHIDDYRNL